MKKSFTILAIPVLLNNLAYAEVVRDGSTGAAPAGAILAEQHPDTGVMTYDIRSELGTISGQNLFHSFGSFNVEQNHTAHFSHTGNESIGNVITRVTGGSPSEIFGRIQSSIEGADFYLLNSAGVLFGEGASLDINGSFYVSTADYLRFEDGVQMNVAAASSGLDLSVAAPASFGFTSSAPAAVELRGAQLDAGAHDVTIVAGNVTMTALEDGQAAAIRSSGGAVQIAAVGTLTSELEVGTQIQSLDTVLSHSETALGDIELDSGATLDVSAATGGKVVIRGGRLTVTDSEIAADNQSFFSGKGGGIDIKLGQEVSISNSEIHAGSSGIGDAGDIDIEAEQVTLAHSALIHSIAFGKAANVDIKAGTVNIEGSDTPWQPTGVLVAGSSGGNVDIQADSFNMEGGYILSQMVGAASESGNISITARTNLTVKNGSAVSTDIVFGEGRGGDITLHGKNVEISGASLSRPYSATTINTSSQSLSGQAGDLTITADESIKISGGAVVKSDRVSSGGKVGDVTIEAPVVEIRGYSEDTFKYWQERGYDEDDAFSIARTKVLVSNQLANAPDASATQSKGNIIISAKDFYLTDGAALLGLNDYVENPGDISISASRMVYIKDGFISADANPGFANGGNVFVDAQLLFLLGGAIKTNADEGAGGDIVLKAQTVIQSPDMVLDASSNLSVDGVISIQAHNLNSAIENIPGHYLALKPFAKNECNLGVQENSFVHADYLLPGMEDRFVYVAYEKGVSSKVNAKRESDSLDVLADLELTCSKQS
ncbi:MAG: filamentous hemagglutinin N-terminal domain-containing protein [Gammaproteobacteria bacterium]|nr:filamentous hemagglutinin N-terminal domain-containing protein [Gammaproteobacteria bacterium]MDH5799684.1 filamentous hemagglutinin N-terminal domain-containing protein [Gammaproteobacteria bacterium]